MKIDIEDTNNGYVVRYNDGSVYVFRSVDDLIMIEDVAKRFLKRRIKAVEQ